MSGHTPWAQIKREKAEPQPCALCLLGKDREDPSRTGRFSPNHYAVYLGDRDFTVTLDGKQMRSVFEAFADPERGWVMLYDEPKRRCEVNQLHAYADLLIGSVEVTKLPYDPISHLRM